MEALCCHLTSAALTQSHLSQTLVPLRLENDMTGMQEWRRAGEGKLALPLSDTPSMLLCHATCFLALQHLFLFCLFTLLADLGKMGTPWGWYGEEERR
jgi:hypothetical protein